jgi:hypothetical protein
MRQKASREWGTHIVGAHIVGTHSSLCAEGGKLCAKGLDWGIGLLEVLTVEAVAFLGLDA